MLYTSLYIIVAQHLLLIHSFIQLFLMVQLLTLCFYPCFCLLVLIHSITNYSFSDYLQLQMSSPPDKIFELHHFMQSCISDVNAWATVNMLKLNDKTELLLVTPKRTKHLHDLPTSITIGHAQIPFTHCEEFGIYIRISFNYD